MSERNILTTACFTNRKIVDALEKLQKYDFMLYTMVKNKIRNGGMFEDVFTCVCHHPFHVPVSVLRKLTELFETDAPAAVFETLHIIFENKGEQEHTYYLDILKKGYQEGIDPELVCQVILTSDSAGNAFRMLDELKHSATKPVPGDFKAEEQDVAGENENDQIDHAGDVKNIADANQYQTHPVQVFYPVEPDAPPYMIETNDDLFQAVSHLLQRIKNIYISQQKHLSRIEATSVGQAERIMELEKLLEDRRDC